MHLKCPSVDNNQRVTWLVELIIIPISNLMRSIGAIWPGFGVFRSVSEVWDSFWHWHFMCPEGKKVNGITVSECLVKHCIQHSKLTFSSCHKTQCALNTDVLAMKLVAVFKPDGNRPQLKTNNELANTHYKIYQNVRIFKSLKI